MAPVDMKMPERAADVRVDNEGTVWMLTPLTEAGRAWLAANVTAEDYQWVGAGVGVGPSLEVERREVWDIVVAMATAGLVVE